jgi:hypothetical protein
MRDVQVDGYPVTSHQWNLLALRCCLHTLLLARLKAVPSAQSIKMQQKVFEAAAHATNNESQYLSRHTFDECPLYFENSNMLSDGPVVTSGDRDKVLRTTLVASTAADRLSDAAGMREAIWKTYAVLHHSSSVGVPTGGFDYTLFIKDLCAAHPLTVVPGSLVNAQQLDGVVAGLHILSARFSTGSSEQLYAAHESTSRAPGSSTSISNAVPRFPGLKRLSVVFGVPIQTSRQLNVEETFIPGFDRNTLSDALHIGLACTINPARVIQGTSKSSSMPAMNCV